jgi:L-lactate dehydrogenase complex protein LldF
MQVQSAKFKAVASEKLADPDLFRALSNLRGRMVAGRAQVVLELDNFEETREAARQVRDRALEHLDFLLEEFERNAIARGAKVHWAENSQQMNQLVLDIARRANVRKVIKSKSMLGEESGLNHFLEQGGIECARRIWRVQHPGIR